jgi:WD40 repeat protein
MRAVSGWQVPASPNVLRLPDCTTGELETLAPIHTSNIQAVSFSTDGNRIVSSSSDKTLRLWDTHSGACVSQPLTGQANQVSSVEFSPDGKVFISVCRAGVVKVWDADTGVALGDPFRGHDTVQVKFSPRGDRILTLSFQRAGQLWDRADFTRIGQLFLKGGVGAFSPDGKLLLGAQKRPPRVHFSTG